MVTGCADEIVIKEVLIRFCPLMSPSDSVAEALESIIGVYAQFNPPTDNPIEVKETANAKFVYV